MVDTKLEKAYLVLIQPPDPPTKAPRLSEVVSTAKGGGEGEIRFLFNPSQYTITKSANWERTPKTGTTSAAMPEFTGSQPATMDLEVFLDHTDRDEPRVAQEVDRLLSAVVPLQKTIDAHQPSPPWAVFGWGSRVSFVALVRSVSATYTLFTSSGVPLRASCSLSLEEVPTDPTPRQNPTSGALAVHRRHRVVAGDTLASIAYRAYGDPARWRALAEANGIDDPLRLADGAVVLLPDLAEG
jgi:nucleoid-associated protein YgaU